MCVYLCVCAQSCLTLCDPTDCSQPGSSVHEIIKQEYWSGLPFSSPRDLPEPGIKSMSLLSPALAGRFFTKCVSAVQQSESVIHVNIATLLQILFPCRSLQNIE